MALEPFNTTFELSRYRLLKEFLTEGSLRPSDVAREWSSRYQDHPVKEKFIKNNEVFV